MFQKIVCPVDFSRASVNAIEYASRLSRVLNASLKVINVQSFFPEVILSQRAEESDRINLHRDLLKDACREVTGAFGISCGYEVIVTTAAMEKAIAEEGDRETIIVMGTNGMDDLFQFFFGTHTYQVIRRSDSPVLLVPEDSQFERDSKVVFADDGTPLTFFQKDLSGFTRKLDSQLTLLHIKDRKNGFMRKLLRPFAGNKSQPIGDAVEVYCENEEDSIDGFMNKNMPAILVMAIAHYGLARKLFGRNKLRKMASVASYPILFLHPDEEND